MVAHEFATPDLGVSTILISDGDLVIEALAVGHAPVEPAVGYRFKYKDRSLLITGRHHRDGQCARIFQRS